ncbi:MAG: nitrous oxide reductase accessory protein NosL [Bacteroidia bacterium]
MKYFLTISVIVIFCACQPKAQEINYGSDACHFCKMTIVDKQHASQLVTSKGKAYVFDSVECMIHYRQISSPETFLFTLVSDYTQPGILIPAEISTFLITPDIPSPMGANLSAFESRSAAMKLVDERSGELFTWTEIQKKLANQ